MFAEVMVAILEIAVVVVVQMVVVQKQITTANTLSKLANFL
tara:strand:+ start:472 stop:594 length:123 start_codon:yes stop_codon:yes gene_type:complete